LIIKVSRTLEVTGVSSTFFLIKLSKLFDYLIRRFTFSQLNYGLLGCST